MAQPIADDDDDDEGDGGKGTRKFIKIWTVKFPAEKKKKDFRKFFFSFSLKNGQSCFFAEYRGGHLS